MFKRNLLCILFFVVINVFATKAQSAADSMLAFFKANPNTTAITVIKNNTLLTNYNGNAILPMAHTANWLVALEYAKQATYNLIDTAERINLKDVVKYYLNNPIQDTYEHWLASMLVQKKIVNNTVSLGQVVQGMIQYSALAYSEYLMDKLGFDNIKSSTKSYNLTNHTVILSPVGALALYQNRTNTSPKKILSAISKMTEEQYCKLAFIMHSAIKNDSTFKDKMPKVPINEASNYMWANKLPQGSTSSYAALLLAILQQQMLDAKYYVMLKAIVEPLLSSNSINKTYSRYAVNNSITTNTIAYSQFVRNETDSYLIVYFLSKPNANNKAKLLQWQPTFNVSVLHNIAFTLQLKQLKKGDFK